MIRYHHQNMSRGRLPLWRYGRAWLGPLHWGWHAFMRTELLSISARRWGVAVYLLWFGFYIGDRGDHDNRGRWELSFHDGCLWFEHPWVRQDGWCRSDPWWRKQVVLHVADWLFGKRRYESRIVETSVVFVPMPEGCYRAIAEREVGVWRRRWYMPLIRRDTWNIKIPGGIPFAGKGESSWNCGDDALHSMSGGLITRLEERIGQVVESVLTSRARNGFDSLLTGEHPSIVVNMSRCSE